MRLTGDIYKWAIKRFLGDFEIWVNA